MSASTTQTKSLAQMIAEVAQEVATLIAVFGLLEPRIHRAEDANAPVVTWDWDAKVFLISLVFFAVAYILTRVRRP